MLNIQPINRPQGLDQTLNVIDIVKNAEVYQKRINELESLREQVNEAIGNLTKAKNLDAALKVAEDKQNEAERILEAAKNRAHEITLETTRNARDEGKRIIEEAKAKEVKILAQAQESKRQADSLKESFEAKMKTLKDWAR